MSQFLTFVNKSRAEPFLLLSGFFISLKIVALQLLIQDKLCLFKHNQPMAFCASLSSSPDSEIKNEILSKANSYMSIVICIQTLPGILWSLVIGTACDRFIKARQMFMILSATSGIVESILLLATLSDFSSGVGSLLLAFIPGSLIGNIFGTLTSVYSYASVNTPANQRSLRYMLLELVWSIGMSLGSYAGGQLLNLAPLGNQNQSKNFSGIFCACLITNAIALAWVIIFINEKDEDNNLDQDSKLDFKAKLFQLVKFFISLFDPRPIKDLWVVSVKVRPNNVRLHLWLLYLAMCFIILPAMGTLMVTFPVVQRIYLWGEVTYSNASSISNILNPIVMMICVPILVKFFNVNDIPLAIVGVVSGILSGIAKGSILTPGGMYLSYLIGPMAGAANVGIRSHVSKIIPKQEISRIFSLLTTLEAGIPLLGTLYQTILFNATINTYPTAVFHSSTILLFIPLLILMAIDLYNTRVHSSNVVKSGDNNLESSRL